MNRIYEGAKFDIGLAAQALNDTNITGRFYSTKNFARALALLCVAAMAATKTATIELLQAKDAAGSEAKGIPSTVGQLATAELTANVSVTEATIDLASVANTDVVTINGVSFTKAAATDVAAREFADAAGLVSCINDITHGVSGVTGSYAGAVVTVEATDPGEAVITLGKTENAGTIDLATTQAQGFVEIMTDKLDFENGFTFIGTKVSTTADTVVSASLVRGAPRFGAAQMVGASAVY